MKLIHLSDFLIEVEEKGKEREQAMENHVVAASFLLD